MRSQRLESRAGVDQLRLDRLAVRLGVGHGARSGEQRPQAAAEPHRLDETADEIENGRGEVDRAHLVGPHRAAGDPAGGAHEQRNAHRVVVEEDPVAVFAVLVEPLAVIGGDEDDGVVGDSPRVEPPHHAPELAIGRGDLGQVEIADHPRPGRGRVEREVGIVEVHPEEERKTGFALEPRERLVHGLGRAPIRLRQPVGLGRVERLVELHVAGSEVVLEEPEPLRDAEPRVEHERGDHGSRVPPRVGQYLRQRLRVVGEAEVGVVAHAVAERRHAGHDRAVARQRDRHVPDRPFDDGPLAGEAVEHRGAGVGTAVDPQPIGPCGVERDEEDVRSGRWLAAAPGEGQHAGERERRREERFGPASARNPRGISRRHRAERSKAPPLPQPWREPSDR